MTTNDDGSRCTDCGHDDPHTTPVDGQYIRCGTCITEGRDAYTLCTSFREAQATQEKRSPSNQSQVSHR